MLKLMVKEIFTILCSKNVDYKNDHPGNVYFCRLHKCFRSLLDKHCRPRPDCSCMSRLIWVHTVCLEILALVNNLSRYMQQRTCADGIFNFVYIFVGAFKVNAIS